MAEVRGPRRTTNRLSGLPVPYVRYRTYTDCWPKILSPEAKQGAELRAAVLFQS